MAKRKRMKKHQEDTSGYATAFTANKYILFNPKFDVSTVYGLLGIHNKVNAAMIVKGKESDFKDNPSQVYRVVKEKKTIIVDKQRGGGINV